jgi:hypothetical protein
LERAIFGSHLRPAALNRYLLNLYLTQIPLVEIFRLDDSLAFLVEIIDFTASPIHIDRVLMSGKTRSPQKSRELQHRA